MISIIVMIIAVLSNPNNLMIVFLANRTNQPSPQPLIHLRWKAFSVEQGLYMEKAKVTIYTDGGADPNPGAGGWGAVLILGEQIEELSGGEEHTTNNRMELTAALRALEALKQPCQIEFYTDSQYLKNGITQWMAKWVLRDWRDSKDEPVQNVDLWQALREAIQAHDITWKWVRGHTGDKYNERADQLATAARPKREQVRDLERAQLFLKIAPPHNGACGWVAKLETQAEKTFYSGSHPDSNPYHMGLVALQNLLRQLPPSQALQIMVEDELIFKGFTQWILGWRAKGWAKPDKYNDLWQALDRLIQTWDIKWYWVKKDDTRLKGEMADLLKHAKTARDQRT